MRKRKSDLSAYSRKARQTKQRRAQLRKRKLMELSASVFVEADDERRATVTEMEANWKAFYLAVARTNMNAMNLYPIQKNYEYDPQQKHIETFLKEEVCEGSLDTQNKVPVKLEFETEEEMDKRLAYGNDLVKIENINSFKVEPIDEEC